jgi:hypothetical protein
MITMKCSTWLDAKAVRGAVKEASIEPLNKCALAIEREAKRSMKQGGKSKSAKGSPYAYYNSALKQWVIASRDGDPPHAQSKTLRNSITHARTKVGSIVVGPTTVAWYGRMHEFGLNKKTGKVKRPFMRPAMLAAMSKFPQFFAGLKLEETKDGRMLLRRK